MFGWGKKRLLAEMEGRANIAQMIVFAWLTENMELEGVDTEDERQMQPMWAAAMANYLFGRAPEERHKQILDLNIVEEMAHRWLRLDDRFRKLIVQTLRVRNTIYYARSGKSPFPIHGEKILAEFGRQYQDAPYPADYEVVVYKHLDLLSPELRQKVHHWIETGS
ncbi:MAG: hypothetical protein ACE5JJ_04175 [Nitrospinota bacterium]